MATGTGPRQRPAPGPMPPSERATPPYGYPAQGRGGRPDRQSWPEHQNWPETDYNGDWYPEEPRWDSGFPETDPNLKYREPGPGMPGYRGSRENRYGGDRFQ